MVVSMDALQVSPSTFHAFLQSRRSVRRFTDQIIPPEVLERILETACRAPSAHNRQPWRFAVIVSREGKGHFAAALGADFLRDLLSDGAVPAEAERLVRRSRDRILGAPVVIVLCLTMAEMDVYPDRHRNRAEFRMAMQSVALAGGQLLLAAHAEGLGGVWVCAPLFAQETARQALELPEDWEPQGMILLGYPDAVPAARERIPARDLTLHR